MRLNDSLKKYVPSLKDVNVVTGDNLYQCCVEIGASNFPNKQFAIATAIAEVTLIGGKVWSDHLTRCIKLNPSIVETVENLAQFLQTYYTIVVEFETKIREATGVPATDAEI